MTTLSQFSAHIRNLNVSRPYLFYVTLLLPEALISETTDIRMVSMFCHSAMTPGLNMYTNDNYVEAGVKRRVAYDYDIQNLTLQFFVDSNYEVKKFFDNWMNKIVGNKRNFEYPKSYTAESIIVSIISLKGDGTGNHDVVYEYKYHNIYPKSIQPIDLNNSAVGVTTFTVDFVFESFTSDVTKVASSSTKGVPAGITNSERLQAFEANKTKIISGGDFASGVATGII